MTAECFRRFCKLYGAKTFTLPWSTDHVTVTDRMIHSVKTGGKAAIGMPRSSGKTSLCVWFAVWCIVFGFKRYIVLVEATKELSETSIEAIKTIFETNDMLADDFPEICHAIRSLSGSNRKSGGQHIEGARTRIEWSADEIIFPTVRGSKASGTKLVIKAIKTAFRGLLQFTAGGDAVRPDLIVINDPQTDELAANPERVQKLENTIEKGVEGLGGVEEPMSILQTVTVIEPDDYADRLLDRERNPAWHGEKMQGVYEMPRRMELWEQYHEIWKESQKKYEDNRLSDKFYRDNQAEMDAGCRVAWPERHPGFETGIQYMMHLCVTKPVFFWSEIQNDPRQAKSPEQRTATSSEIQRLVANNQQVVIPDDCQMLTAFMDVQQDVAFWLVAGWNEQGGCRIVDYGSYPEQPRPYWDLRTLSHTFRSVSGLAEIKDAIQHGITTAASDVITRRYAKMDGTALPISMLLVDEGFEQERIVLAIAEAASKTQSVGRIIPAKGHSIAASNLPMDMWQIQQTDILGDHWIFSSGYRSKLPHVHVIVDTNHWKTETHNRFFVDPDRAEGIILPGSDPYGNQMLADHLASNYRVPTAGRGRKLDEWKLKPGARDDWFDCLVGSFVAKSLVAVVANVQRQQRTRAPDQAGSLKASDGRSFFLQNR